MTDGQQKPAKDRSFAVSVITHLAGGVALVLATAAAFWGLGQIQAPGTPPIDTPDDLAVGEETPPAEEPEPTPEPDPEPEPDPTPDPVEEPEGEPEQEPEPDLPAFEPGEIRIQVLNAAGDGGARMQALAARLREEGYVVVATHPAARIYERSTAFYTQGRTDMARFVVAHHPEFGVVEEKPDNLSDTVDVHLVVGQDYPAP